jgi:hypothetical protein
LRTAVAPDRVGDALVRIVKILRRFQEEPVSEKDLRAARGFLTGMMQSALVSGEALTRHLLHLAAHNLLIRYRQRYGQEIQVVDSATVSALAQRYLDRNRWAVVVVGPGQALRHIDYWKSEIQVGTVTPGIHPQGKEVKDMEKNFVLSDGKAYLAANGPSCTCSTETSAPVWTLF